MGILIFFLVILLAYILRHRPVIISIFLIFFSSIVSLYIGSLGLIYYNYVILIPILGGLCVLFYYISCICFDRDDDSFNIFLYLYIFFICLIYYKVDMFTLNTSIIQNNIVFYYNRDISWCVRTIMYLCLCLVIVVKLCRNLFLPLSSID